MKLCVKARQFINKMQKITPSVNLVLCVLSETFTIHKLSPDLSIPEEILKSNYYSVTKQIMNCQWYVQN
ncbi:MAG: hypothetical protein CM1200mP30_27080 [Pseudomonadota bacterium]|nr:MAG: hypothetical protein CM1200mP30_27080 [Pseudomonadota bacterium]